MAIIWTDELLKLFEFQKNYCIQAGAGSGKTTTLVELYLRILLNSRNTDNPLLPENILALTFTDKAATELRERIYSRIQEELKISENNQDTAAYDYLKKISDNLRFAKIGTFHSFCMQLLKQYSIDYGISPDFEIIDNIEDLKITELFFEETLKKNFADDIEYAAVLLREFRIINNFSDKLLKIYENIRNKGVHIETLYENSKNLINEKMPEQSEIICQINECLNKIKNISSPAETIKKFIDNLKTLNLQITEQITNLELFKLSEIIKGNWGNNKYLKDELKDAVDELIKIRFFPILNKITYLIVKIIFEAHKKIIEYKINNSTINFNDLLEFVVDLLNKNQTILNACKKQYQKVLVDEFQDTNYLQEELLKLLVFNNGILQNKKICIVGDVKQSIYRFRGAEARIMIDWQNKIFNNENSVVIFLSQNRRSVKTIVDFVNGLFTQIMAGSQNDGTLIKYDPHHKMTSAREDIQNNSFAVEFILLDFNGANAVNKTNCDTADNDDADQEQLDITNCYLEGLALAKKINELVGNFYVLDKRTDNLKKCQYKDITVLLRSFNNVKQYEQALREKNIPFYTVKGRGFFECYEIIDIINFLKLVVNPNNFNILIAVLRSPFMFLSDDQIYLIVKQLQENIEVSNLYFDENYFSEIDKNRINDFFKFLNYYNHCFSEMSIAELLRVIFEKFEYCEFLAAQFNAEKKLANVNKLIDLAIAYTNTRNINNFIEWLDKLTEQSSSENEAELIDENANVVKIMTVHQSKGLEFPIIIVPNTNRGAVNNKDFVRFSRTEFYIKLKNLIGKDFNNENFDKINIHEKIADTEEEHRIFYTACTRARDCLILMAVRNIKYKGYKETYAQKIEDYIKKLKSEKIKFSEIKKMSELDFNNAETKELEISEDIITKKFLKLQELKKLDYLELKEWDFSVVEFAKFILSCQNSNNNFIADDWLKSENIDEIAKLKNSDIADGLFAHFILKNFDFYNNANNNLNKYLDDYNDKNNISNPAKIYENIIAAVETLKNKLSDFYEFVIEKELPFVLRLKAKDYTIRLHGVIDVLFYNENKIVLVDYKYSTFKEENQQYKIQMMIYALALFEIFGKYPDEIYICYLCDNDKLRLLNISNDDLKIFSEEIFRYLKEYNKLLISGKYEN